MYCDDIRGIFPLLIFPDEFIKDNKKKMAPVNFHPIWALSAKGESNSDNINLIYRGNIYIAREYQFYPEIEERKTHYIEALCKKIVSILVLPKKMNLLRRNFLKIALENTIQEFKLFFHKIVISEILKQDLIKLPKNESVIKEGEILKENIKNLLKNILLEYKQDLEKLESNARNLKEVGILFNLIFKS